jgi:hypothetical protein
MVRKVWLEMPFTGLVHHDDDAAPALSPRFVSSPERPRQREAENAPVER